MSTPLHPLLVHFPIALAVLMPLIALALLLAWRQGALPRRTWLIAVALQAALVGSGFAASQTGEADEERVEAVVPEAALEAHEEAAEVFVYGAAAVLGIALLAAVIRQERAARWIAGVATLGTIAVLGLGYRTGQAGGKLVYEHGAASAYTTAPAQGPPAASERAPDHDDHD